MRKSLKTMVMAAAVICLVVTGTAQSSQAQAPPPGQITMGNYSFPTGSGQVDCNYNAGSSYGVRDNPGPYWVKAQFTSLPGGTGCIRNGVDITGTDAGQYYMIYAFKIDRNATNFHFTSFPVVVPHNAGGWSYNPTSSVSDAWTGTITNLIAVCAGGAGGQCGFPVVVSTLAYPNG